MSHHEWIGNLKAGDKVGVVRWGWRDITDAWIGDVAERTAAGRIKVTDSTGQTFTFMPNGNRFGDRHVQLHPVDKARTLIALQRSRNALNIAADRLGGIVGTVGKSDDIEKIKALAAAIHAIVVAS